MKRKIGNVYSPAPPQVMPIIRRGIYVSDFNNICGNKLEENNLLDWCIANNLNTLYYYDMSSVLESSYDAFANFWTEANSQGIIFQSTERGSENRLIGIPFNSTKNYNIANPTKLCSFGFENEFWNYNLQIRGTELEYPSIEYFPPIGSSAYTYVDMSDVNNTRYYVWNPSQYVQLIQLPDSNGNVIYSNWIKQQRSIYSYAKSVGLSSDFYIGLIRDLILNTPATQIALDMVQCTDRIYLSWYVTSAEFDSADAGLNFVRTRLNLLGEAAYSLGKKIQILPIFAGTSEFMQDWFATPGNTLLSAYNKAMASYNANVNGDINPNAKLGITFNCGYQGYAIAR
jgi:hypothetical protein